MSTIRNQKNKQNPYVMLNKTALDDPNLSFKAKGIFAYLMSKPDDWKCQVNDLKNKSKDGRDSIYAGIKELREHGYIIKRPIKNDKNVIIEWEEVLYETPQEEAKDIFKQQEIINEKAAVKRAETIKMKNKPYPENPEVENSTSGKAVSGKAVSGKAVNIISNDTTNNDLLSNELVVGEVEISLIEEFEDNICELKKTTLKKFKDFCEQYSREFIETVIEYAASINIKTYAGFEIIIEKYISKNIITREAVLADIKEFRNNKKNKTIPTAKKKSEFTNIILGEDAKKGFDGSELERNLLRY